jgi:hypothetical protein
VFCRILVVLTGQRQIRGGKLYLSSIYLSIYPSVIYLSIYPSIHPFIHPLSTHLSIHPLTQQLPFHPSSTYLPTHPSIHPPFYLSIFLSSSVITYVENVSSSSSTHRYIPPASATCILHRLHSLFKAPRTTIA